MVMEDRLARQEQQIQFLMGRQPVPPQNQSRDKEITIRQIVEDERKLLDDRFQGDLHRIREEKDFQLKKLSEEGISNKTQNQKLQRLVIEKENELIKA